MGLDQCVLIHHDGEENFQISAVTYRKGKVTKRKRLYHLQAFGIHGFKCYCN